MLRKIVIRLLLVIIVAVVVGLFLPSRIHVERSTVIGAAPEAIYPLVASFKDGWSKWSPWTAAEVPNLKYAYEGPESGVGAVQNWTSDGERAHGSGRQRSGEGGRVRDPLRRVRAASGVDLARDGG